MDITPAVSRYVSRVAITDLGAIAKYHGYTLSSVFQKIFSSLGDVIGVESLLRVTDSDGVSIPPDQFFAQASHSEEDVITIDRIARVIHTVNFSASEMSDKRLFLNVMPAITHDPLYKGGEVYQAWDYLLSVLNVSPNQIVYEIVENECDDDSTLVFAAEHMRLGDHQIAVDDFGAGHSREDRVAAIRPDILKVDRAILDQITQGNFSQFDASLACAKKFECTLVAEGIETQKQLDIVVSRGVSWLQGYFLHAPQSLSYQFNYETKAYFEAVRC